MATYEIFLKSWKDDINIEEQPVVNNSALFGVPGIQRIVLAILVHQVAEDGATVTEKAPKSKIMFRVPHSSLILRTINLCVGGGIFISMRVFNGKTFYT